MIAFFAALIFLPFLLSSCYRVNEADYLNITFNDSKISPVFLEKYIDSVKNKNLIIPDSINYKFLGGDKIGENQRIIYFNNTPKEWYNISFDATPCVILSIYNKELYSDMISKRDILGKEQLQRIELRFKTEVMDSAELYGKRHHLADSIIYENPNLK